MIALFDRQETIAAVPSYYLMSVERLFVTTLLPVASGTSALYFFFLLNRRFTFQS